MSPSPPHLCPRHYCSACLHCVCPQRVSVSLVSLSQLHFCPRYHCPRHVSVPVVSPSPRLCPRHHCSSCLRRVSGSLESLSLLCLCPRYYCSSHYTIVSNTFVRFLMICDDLAVSQTLKHIVQIDVSQWIHILRVSQQEYIALNHDVIHISWDMNRIKHETLPLTALRPANDDAMSECSEIIGMRDLPFLGCHCRVAEMSLSPKCPRNVSVPEMSLSPKVIPYLDIGIIILVFAPP